LTTLGPIPNIAPRFAARRHMLFRSVSRATSTVKPSDLQLNLHEIPEAGITLDGALPAEWVAESLLDPYRALSPVTVHLDVERMGDNVLVRGRAAVELAYDCSRTGQPSTTRLEASFAELFIEGDKHHHNMSDLEVSSDDVEDEPWVIEDGKIDLEALVRESIVLAQDPYPLAPGLARDGADEGEPAWSSYETLPAAPSVEPGAPPAKAERVDPRWERLRTLKLD